MIRYKNIYGPRSQRPNHGDLNDDPGVLMGLPPLEKSSEFWKRYDRQADTHDTKMTENLSENLDVLLIFAALFSAINTTFISLSMPGLSSDQMTETNALLRLIVTRPDNNTIIPADLSPPFVPSLNSVVVNCLLYASLSCSLLAAVGAMMAKEWLQSFDRTGQTGPLEEQGRFRQRKFNGVQQWYLEPIIQFLPNLLLLSVVLFFIGVYLFLLPVNLAVAGVVIAFSGGGAVLYGVAIVAGATAPLCPYQSAASRALKRTLLLFSLQWWRDLLRAGADLVVRGPPKLVRKIFGATNRYPNIAPAIIEIGPIKPLSTTLGEAGIPEQVVIAQAAGWLIRATSNPGDQIAAAQFICTLDNTVCISALERSETWRHLTSLTHEAFDIWHSQPSERNQEIAELFGLALCQVLLQPPLNGDIKRKHLIDHPLYQTRSFGGAFLRALEFAATNYSYYKPEDKEMILHIAFIFAIVSRGSVILEYQWPRLSRGCLIGNTHHLADVLLGLWAIIFYNLDPNRSRHSRAFVDLVDNGDNKIVLAQHLTNAVLCGARVLPSVRGNLQSDLLGARGYTACLQRAVELSHEISSGSLVKMADSVADMMVSYVNPLISSTPGESCSELVGISIKTVLALHAFISRNPHANEKAIIRDERAEQLRNDHVINAAVHIMLDDLESLTTSELLPRTQPQALARARALALNLARKRVRQMQVRVRVQVQGKQVQVQAGEWAKDPAAEQLVQWVQGEARKRAELQAQMQALPLTLKKSQANLDGQARVEALAQVEAQALLRVLAPALAQKVAQGVAKEVAKEVTKEVTQEVAQEVAPDLAPELARELTRELTRELERELAQELAQELGADLGWVRSQVNDEVLGQVLGQVLGPVLDRMLDRVLGRALSQVLILVLDRAQMIAQDLAKRLRVESCIIKILLWVGKRTSSTQLGDSDKRKIFLSSCRLWAPLERRVDFAVNGIEWGLNGERLTFSDRTRAKLLTPGDLDGIVEFVEDLQKDMGKFEFIVHRTDVEINRLCAHFNRQVDWDYDLYDLREQRTLCSRSTAIKDWVI